MPRVRTVLSSAETSLLKAREEVAAVRVHAENGKLITEKPAVLRWEELQTLAALPNAEFRVVASTDHVRNAIALNARRNYNPDP